MFGIGWPEFLLIGVVAIIVIGPQDIPKALYNLGKMMRKMRAVTRSVTDGLDEITKDAELDDIVSQANAIGGDDVEVLTAHQKAKEEAIAKRQAVEGESHSKVKSKPKSKSKSKSKSKASQKPKPKNKSPKKSS